MSIETFDALEKAIKDENILKKYELEKIGIFGSFARGETANDIDFFYFVNSPFYYFQINFSPHFA
jgi:predicted nucleotidyltransferase